MFTDTRQQLEQEGGGERWDFDPKPIRNKPDHMKNILKDFILIAENLKKFLVLLGPGLKAVTGNTESIDD